MIKLSNLYLRAIFSLSSEDPAYRYHYAVAGRCHQTYTSDSTQLETPQRLRQAAPTTANSLIRESL